MRIALAGLALAGQFTPRQPRTSPIMSFNWDGFENSHIQGLARPLLVAKGSKGYAACAYIDVATAEKLNEACIIFSGVNTCDDFVDAEVKKVSPAAEALGCAVGMKGGDALELLR